ncbi:hypothetical protein [Haloarcula litorea]|uniref:hypothetical protein n=1 Tax=Haloarcula litorea TaxID=3032579 RepID=UPI0023E7F024|nr:hypothetical protein [Halomicroarcula sp. GDY20]
MNETVINETRDEPTEKFYLPAVALPPNLDRIEAVVEDLFDLHGVVLIPDSYNE